MAILVAIFALIVVGIIVLTFRTSGKLSMSEQRLEELRRQIE